MNKPFINRPLTASVLLLSLISASALFLFACGGGGDSPSPDSIPPGSIAVVGDVTIPVATYKRRLKSELRGIAPLSGAFSSSRVIDPPHYARCIRDLRKLSAKTADGASTERKPSLPTRSQLRQNCEQQHRQIRSDTVSDLIREQWLIQSAEADGFELPDEQVRDRLNQFESAQISEDGSNRFNVLLKRAGLKRADLKDQLRATLASQRSLLKVTAAADKPSDEDLEKFYSENPQLFGKPGERTIEVVAVGDEAAAEDAAKSIKSGKSVAAVSVDVSDDVAVLGGDGFLSVQQGPGSQPTGLVDQVFAVPVNELTGPVEADGNWYIFKVVNETPADVPPFKKIKGQVADRAASALIQQAQVKTGNELQSEWRPKTVCAKGFTVAECSNGPDLPDAPLP